MNARESLEKALLLPDFQDLTSIPNLVSDLRYGTTNNLLKKDVYKGFQKVILHRYAAQKFQHACILLEKNYPHYKFIVFDALRPQSAQIEFWNLVKDTPQQIYFANPQKGSIHSFGFAIDVSIVNETGKELDMGTEFDDLSPKAQPQEEENQLRSGILTQLQIRNRMILRNIMLEAGFLQLPHEWWHYDALPPKDVREKYTIVE